MTQSNIVKIGLVILAVSTLKVLFPMRRIEYYLLKFKKSLSDSKQTTNKPFDFWYQSDWIKNGCHVALELS